MHITIGLKKQLVLMNNIFNPHEFELYGRGVLLQPDKPCHCYFKNTCEHQAYQCMDHLAPMTVADAVTERLQHVH
jgi:heptosyltransferase-2